MILCKWEAKGPPRPVQALEASACGPSDGFYAGGLYAEGTEVAKESRIELLSLKSVLLRKWFHREHLFYIMAAGFQCLCHQMDLSIKVRWTTPLRSPYLGANRPEMQKFFIATSSSAMARLWGHHLLMSLVSRRHKSNKIDDILTSRVGGLGNMQILQTMPPSLINFLKPYFPSFISLPQCSSLPFRPSAGESGPNRRGSSWAPASTHWEWACQTT